MDTFGIVADELGIPPKYIKTTTTKNRVVIVVHKSWLKLLLKTHQIPEFIYHESLTLEEVEAWLHQGEELGASWQRLFVRVLLKQRKKVIPLPRARAISSKTEPDLSFAQLLHYVSQTNHKNLWKEAFKKYLSGNISGDGKGSPSIHLVKYDTVMREIITRTYGCPIISMTPRIVDTSSSDAKVKAFETHSNVLPALCALEMSSCFLILQHPHISHTLQDCVTFSPAMLGTSHAKPLFIMYQLLQTMRSMHDRGLVLGDVTLNDILVEENLWIQVMPKLEDNIHDKPKTERKKSSKNSMTFSKSRDQSKEEEEEDGEDEEDEDDEIDDISGVKKCSYCKSSLKIQSSELNSHSSPLSSLDHTQEMSLGCQHYDTHSKESVQNNSTHSCRDTKTLDDIRSSYMRTLGVIPGSHRLSQNRLQGDGAGTDANEVDVNERADIEQLCKMWVYGQLSNFEYLTFLNRMAGRRYGDPTCHHVMPWVTDFSSRSGANWRDLSRSKFRLNKGDRQLDLTYDTAAGASQVPHHVSDVLSEITYYVYLSRRTPRSVLCKYVRSNWVPAEYPSSIQRLQEWTPDECIPEFFTNCTVFESIHDDLPDLEIPPWASTAQDFIQKHRDALESVHVSERLHHWIDLTFGYKLSGSAAVKSKNVCLQLVDSHTTLTNTGVVQLFTQPHPQRHTPSPFWGKTPPKLHLPPRDKKKPSERVSEDESHSSGFEEDESATLQGQARSSPLALTRLLSRSRGSLLAPFPSQSTEESGSRDRQIEQQKSSGSSCTNVAAPTIVLPKEYNPAAALQAVEQLHGFLSKTFHCNSTSPVPQSQHQESTVSVTYKQVVAGRRIREMQVLGCLVIELFLASKLRALGSSSSFSFSQRLDACLSVLTRSGESVPRCVRQAIALLLQVDLNPTSYNDEENIIERGEDISKLSEQSTKTVHPFRYPTVTFQGLPPPSAHQLLQPLLSSVVFPFPRHFTRTYALLQTLHEYSSTARELSLTCFVSDDEGACVKSEAENKKALLVGKISEFKVKTSAKELSTLLPEMLSSSPESLDLILPYMKDMLEDSSTSVLAAWHLFDLMAKVLGPQKTATTLLEPIVKLYDYASNEDNGLNASDMGNKHVKLYHRSFLLQLIVRLGLRVFLENFVTPLVEAVGGYRDVMHSEHSHHHHRSDFRNKASHLKSCELEDGAQDGEGVLSPLDEDSSADSDQNKPNDSAEGKEKEKVEEEASDTEVEPEVFVFETEENEKPSPPGEGETPLYNLMDHLDLNLPQTSGEVEDNSSFELQGDDEPVPLLEEEVEDTVSTHAEQSSPPEGEPKSPGHGAVSGKNSERSKELDASGDADISSIRSESDNSFTCGQASVHRDDKSRKFTSHCKVSDMSVDSVVWLSHRLGPVLTARHLSRNLLRMLTLCYLGQENLSTLPSGSNDSQDNHDTLTINISKGSVVGDQNAIKVLECLSSIAALYGEQIILLQYLPHMGELIALCKRKLTVNLEGGLVGCLALLKHIIPYLCDSTLMDQLQDVILKTILHPAIRLVSTTRFMFPSGSVARAAVTSKFVDALYVVALRIGCEMTRRHLAVPSLQRFFLTFDKAFGRPGPQHVEDVTAVAVKGTETRKDSPLRSLEESNYLEIRRDGTTAEWIVKGMPMQISHVRVRESDSADSFSPPPLTGSEGEHPHDHIRNKAVEELKQVFTAELAHMTYLPFFRFLGESVMDTSLKNHDFIRDLCYEYEQEMQSTHPTGGPVDVLYLSDYLSPGGQGDPDKITGSGSFGSNVAVVGNRIDLQRADISSLQLLPSGSPNVQAPGGDVMALISRKMENTNRHLHGNWLAYWEHEIGRAEKDTHFNFKQIKLQTFSGHTNSVRAVLALDNENSFLSGSRDKTVKLWSLRSQGDGSAVSQCQWTYTGHRKTVLAITFLESLRLAASCDSVVHLWDPFMGSVVAQLDSSRTPPITVLRAMPPPSTSLMAATTDATLRLLDARTSTFVNELKVSLSPAGLIRCIAVGPSGYWVAVGQSSGYLTILDIRTGMVLASWKGHEGEVLQLVASTDSLLVSSSLDQTVSTWSAVDGKLSFHMKGPTEPVHCMSGYGSELISGTTANRIGVHTAVDMQASFSSTRLRSDTFKGVLTAMAVLPLNRLLLLGADTGNISLLC